MTDPQKPLSQTTPWTMGPLQNERDESELPSLPMRQIGAAWLRLYGHMVEGDPFFVASCVYRIMRLARVHPHAPELSHLWIEVGKGGL